MAADWDADVTLVRAWTFRDDASKPITHRTWDLSLACGSSGGVRLEVDAIHLNDLLRDSGIHEPGDMAYMDFGPPVAAAVPRELRSWRRITLESWRLERQAGWGARLVLNPGARRSWALRLGARPWMQLCSFAVACVEHPWFEALRAR